MTYKSVFNSNSESSAKGHGRIEIIGNFTDQLDGGHAIGAPIQKHVQCEIGSSDNNLINCYSENFPDSGIISIDPQNMSKQTDKTNNWVDYISSIVNQLQLAGHNIKPCNIHLSSDIPKTGGVSSSAALEMAVCHALINYNSIDTSSLTKVDIAKLCRASEVDPKFVDSSCGYLDQGCSISDGVAFMQFFNDSENPYTSETLNFDDFTQSGYRLVLGVDISRSRVLSESGYPTKAKYVNDINDYLTKKAISPSELSAEDLKKYKEEIEIGFSAEGYKAINHVVSDNQRVLETKKAIESKDYEKFAELLNASGDSSLENYDVAGGVPQLRDLVHSAREAGALAARNHGGGWNTNYLFLTTEADSDAVKAKISELYMVKYPQAELDFIDINLR